MKAKRKMLVILAGLTMCVAWPGGIWLLFSRMHTPDWLIGAAFIAIFFLALWATVKLLQINEAAEREEASAKYAASCQQMYYELARQCEHYYEKENRQV